MTEVEGVVIDLDTLVKVVVGQVESEFLVGQKFKKFVEDIGGWFKSLDDIFAYMPSLEDVHELDNLLQKK